MSPWLQNKKAIEDFSSLALLNSRKYVAFKLEMWSRKEWIPNRIQDLVFGQKDRDRFDGLWRERIVDITCTNNE